MEATFRPPDWATHLLSDHDDWHRAPRPVADLEPLILPDDAWFEYAWLDAAGTPRADPDGVPADNPWWPHACRLRGPEYAEDPVAAEAAGRAPGRLERFRLRSAALRQDRYVFHYSTDGATTPGPLVLFQDGKAYWHHGRAGAGADVLRRRGEIPPVHLAFLQPERRTVEYAFNTDYEAFVHDEALPALAARLACVGRPRLAGVSLGGLCSAWLALRRPAAFAAVAAQSGAFLIAPDDRPPDPSAGGEWLLGELLAGRGRDLRWHLDCGTLEWLHPAHRRLCAALADGGSDHACRERSIGHNWENWRNGLPAALRFLLARGE